MLSLKSTYPLLFTSSKKLPFTISPPKHPNPKPNLLSLSSLCPPIKAMSQTIEHIVLFKVKDSTDPLKVNHMVNSLNGLISLDSVLHLTSTPLHRTRSSPIPFTHILHSRYPSKDSLFAYSDHSDHLSVVRSSVLPITDEIMAVDWVAPNQFGPVPPGSAVRVSFLQLKEGLGEEVKNAIFEVIRGIKDKFPVINQLSCGENFSPARAKGYSIACLAVFPSLKEMDDVDSNSDIASLEKDKVRDYLESVIVVDFVVPSSASL